MKDIVTLYRRLASEACHELAWRMPDLGIRAEAALTRLGDRIQAPVEAPTLPKGLFQTLPPEGVPWKSPEPITIEGVERIYADLEAHGWKV